MRDEASSFLLSRTEADAQHEVSSRPVHLSLLSRSPGVPGLVRRPESSAVWCRYLRRWSLRGVVIGANSPGSQQPPWDRLRPLLSRPVLTTALFLRPLFGAMAHTGSIHSVPRTTLLDTVCSLTSSRFLHVFAFRNGASAPSIPSPQLGAHPRPAHERAP